MPVLLIRAMYSEISTVVEHIAGAFTALVIVVMGYGAIANAVVYTGFLPEGSGVIAIEGWGPLVTIYVLNFMLTTTVLKTVVDSSPFLSALSSHRQKHEFAEKNVWNTVQLFHKDLQIWVRRLTAETSKYNDLFLHKRGFKGGRTAVTITTVTEMFKMQTREKLNKTAENRDCCVRCLYGPCGIMVVPLLLALVQAFLPGGVRAARGDVFTGGYSEVEIYVASMYIILSFLILSWLFVALNAWLNAAAEALFRYAAVPALASSYKSDGFGLNFHIQLTTPNNLKGFMLVRRRLYNVVKEDLDSLFPMDTLLAPLLVMTFLVAIAIFINVISGESLGVFNIVGFYDCVVLTLYVVAVLFIAAYANMLLNEKVNNFCIFLNFDSQCS